MGSTNPEEDPATQVTPEPAKERPPRAKKIAVPQLPYSQAAQELGETTCIAEVVVNPRGRAEDVSILSCPATFHSSLQDVIARSRWERAEYKKTKVRVTFRP